MEKEDKNRSYNASDGNGILYINNSVEKGARHTTKGAL